MKATLQDWKKKSSAAVLADLIIAQAMNEAAVGI